MTKDYLTKTAREEMLLDKTLQREMNLAKNIQSTLLNGEVPDFARAEVTGSSHPARLIGGDYFDFYRLKNDKYRIVIGDVMGKGIPAAMIMILTRGAFRSSTESNQGPGATLHAMNKALYKDLRTLRSFVTLFCADWDPKTGVLTYANAGHNLPIFIRAKSNCAYALPKVKGVMVGGLPDQVYQEESINLETNDIVLFYTDGIIEAQNKDAEQYQLERLMGTLKEHQDKHVDEIERSIIESITTFTEGVPQKDDITMVLLKICKEKTATISNFSDINP